MNYREVLPALSAIAATIFLLAGVALSDQDLSSGEAIKAQSQGFDALAHQVFDTRSMDVVTISATASSEGIIK